MHTGTKKYDVSLAKKFQHFLKKKHCKDGVIDQEKYKKIFMERKWTDRQYHVQYNADVANQDVNCIVTQIRLSKHCHLRFHPKLGMGICAIFCIPCTYVAYISMLDKPWISSIQSDEQERYKPVTKCTYWPMLGSFNNRNNIRLSYKSTPFDAFDEIQQVVLDGISDIMALLVESEKIWCHKQN